MQKILIIGGGGIGSWLVARLSRLQEYDQLKDAFITIVDDDEVEKKNLPYQNFDITDLTDSKAETLEAKYGIASKNLRVTTEDHLKGYDIIVCAVDNSKTRYLVFKYCLKTGVYFIDLRAEGTAVWGVTSDTNLSLEQLKATLVDMDEADRSCQLEYELSAGIIQTGNIIIAEVGAQWILNKVRGKKTPGIFSRKF